MSELSSAGAKYAERTDESTLETWGRPAIGDVPINAVHKTRHQSTLEAWNELSPEQQEKVMAEGNWTPGSEVEVEERKQKHARRH